MHDCLPVHTPRPSTMAANIQKLLPEAATATVFPGSELGTRKEWKVSNLVGGDQTSWSH